MMARVMDAPTIGQDERQDAWAWSIPGWHGAFWILLVVVGAFGWFDIEPVAERVVHLSLVVALGLAYAFIGARAVRTRETWRRHLYRTILVITVGGMIAMDPNSASFLFIAFPQVWVLGDDIREGVGYSVALAVAVGLGLLATAGWSSDALAPIVGSMAVGLAVSLAVGIWITRVIEQSQERAALIDRLHATQDELATAHHAAGVIAERERLAGEIHDTLAQGFTSVVMHAQAARAELARDRTASVDARLAAIEATARENLDEARALVAAFAPAALANATLVEALHRLATRFESETNVRVDVSCTPSESVAAGLHPGSQVVLLRAAQEGLTNVGKHAGPTHVHIRVAVDEDADIAQIEVTDDGRGFEPAVVAETAAGFGLAGMRGRVEQVGGTIEVASAPGRGTCVRVTVPGGAT
jgi:signal transduction histidine kinase